MEHSVATMMNNIGQQAKSAAKRMVMVASDRKNLALQHAAALLRQECDAIMQANGLDMAAADAKGLSEALKDRLMLNGARIEAMAVGLEQVAGLADPVGAISDLVYRPSGIQVGHMRVPLGVIGMIYESRPNVTIDAAALCLKSGNAVILRGGSESIHSNRALALLMQQALRDSDLPEHAVQLIDSIDRAMVGALLRANAYVDVIIPRGGRSLTERVANESTVPVIKHLDGICHVYIDKDADEKMAVNIAMNAKTHRYGVCNAMETLLVHHDAMAILTPLLPMLLEKGVKVMASADICAAYAELPLQLAVEEDWRTEYLAPELSIRLVDSVEMAMEHIATYGSGHTESIVTDSYATGQLFLRSVDSSSVMWNASTRFADGFEYGLGAEIGISTDRLHVRGPVGLDGLTTQKWIVLGSGQVRS
ncbi:MAG: glutamate-5-semialdehyde dehydrogenase [Zetaproteobacteria bacterium]|nr:glutamate-5-semialdehyde dehydrogenase [Zetaproteobacteria bacterium]